MRKTIYINGANGRMGKAIKALQTDDTWFLCSSDIDSAELIVDFSRPAGLLDGLQKAQAYSVPFVSGTTGLEQQHLTALDKASKIIPVLWSANMSLGMNLLYQLSAKLATQLPDADIEIFEAHHRYKKDAPSGSAIQLGEHIATAKNQVLSQQAVFDRTQQLTARNKGEIGFSVMRSGDIVGEHTALFGLDGERIELTHRATDRAIFARGALHAAHWLFRQQPGHYTFIDTLS